jgi:hypothetical protein
VLGRLIGEAAAKKSNEIKVPGIEHTVLEAFVKFVDGNCHFHYPTIFAYEQHDGNAAACLRSVKLYFALLELGCPPSARDSVLQGLKEELENDASNIDRDFGLEDIGSETLKLVLARKEGMEGHMARFFVQLFTYTVGVGMMDREAIDRLPEEFRNAVVDQILLEVRKIPPEKVGLNPFGDRRSFWVEDEWLDRHFPLPK